MEDETYNGWTNYETWVIALWMGNDQGSYLYWQDQAGECFNDTDEEEQRDERRRASRSALADRIQEVFESDSPLADQASAYSDLLTAALGSVDWYEIAEHLIDEYIESNKEE